MKPTIKEIAQQCGISEGTVDRALNGRAGISEATRRRILETAQRLNYTPNRIAQSLATGRTKTIGILCFDLINNFFTRLIDIIEAEAKSKGYFINLILTHRDMRKELEGIRYLAERRVDGIILFPVGKGADYIEYLKSLRIPIVTIYNKVSDDFPHIGLDDRKAMFDAVRYISSRGYGNIVLVTPEVRNQEKNGANVFTMHRRRKGYEDGLIASGSKQEPLVLEGKDFSKTFQRVDFSSKPAFLCVCDTYALCVLRHLRSVGLSIPEDAGLMGFDNIDVLEFIRPRLTTIEYHVEKMGRHVFQTVYASICGEPVETEHLLDYAIVKGETI